MHPELLSSLATEHRHDLVAAGAARAPFSTGPLSSTGSLAATEPSAPATGRRRGPRLTLPRYRVSWTRANLAAVAGNRRARSVVIVISATRSL